MVSPLLRRGGALLVAALLSISLGCSGTTTGGAPADGSTPASGSGAGPGASSDSGASAADFTLPALDGSTVHLSDFRGKVVLLDFWSTTCDPCLAAMPHLVELYKKEKENGLVVL